MVAVAETGSIRADLLAISAAGHSRDCRIAARLLAEPVSEAILRENVPELMVVASQELGLGVACEMQRLAIDFDLLSARPRD